MDTEIFRVSSRPLRISKRMPPYKSVLIRTHPYHTTLSLLPRFYGLRVRANRKSTRKGLEKG